MKVSIMDDDRMVKSAWTPEVRMHAIIFIVFVRAVDDARAREPPPVEKGKPHTAGVTTRGGLGRARGVTSRGTFATTTTGKRTAMREWRRERVRREFSSSFPRRLARCRTSESVATGVDVGGVHARGAGPQPLAPSYRYAGGWGLASAKDYGICLFVCFVF